MKHLPDVRDKLNTGALDAGVSDAIAQFLSGTLTKIAGERKQHLIVHVRVFFKKNAHSVVGEQYWSTGWIATRYFCCACEFGYLTDKLAIC